METLPFETFLEVIKEQPVEEISALCQTSRRIATYCRRDDFWDRLIAHSYNVITEDATRDDYIFFYAIANITRMPGENLNRLIDQLITNEMAGWKTGNLSYFMVEPSRTREGTMYEPVDGVIITAYTLSGALLKLREALLPQEELLGIYAKQRRTPKEVLSIFESLMIQLDPEVVEYQTINWNLFRDPDDPKVTLVLDGMRAEEELSTSPYKLYIIEGTPLLVLPKHPIIRAKTKQGAFYLLNYYLKKEAKHKSSHEKLERNLRVYIQTRGLERGWMHDILSNRHSGLTFFSYNEMPTI